MLRAKQAPKKYKNDKCVYISSSTFLQGRKIVWVFCWFNFLNHLTAGKRKACASTQEGMGEQCQKWGEKEENEQDASLELFNWYGKKSKLLDAIGGTRNRDTSPDHITGSSSKARGQFRWPEMVWHQSLVLVLEGKVSISSLSGTLGKF